VTDGRLEVEVTLRLTVSQSVGYVLVSSALVGLATRYYLLSECCSLKFTVLFLWGAHCRGIPRVDTACNNSCILGFFGYHGNSVYQAAASYRFA
jgi:hypothetical protein